MSLNTLLNKGNKKLPVIYQSEAAECGLACIAMIAGYHGYKVSLPLLRQKFDTSLRGMTFKSIMYVSARLNLSARALKVPLEIIGDIKLPAIIHWNLNHFVVLKKVSKKRVIIHDPSRGFVALSKDEFSNSYTGVALEIQPTSEFEMKKETAKLKISDFWSKITGLKRGLLQLLILSLFLQFILLVSPMFLQIVMDEVLSKANFNLLTVLALGFGALVLINAATELLRSYVSISLGAHISFQIASNVYSHLLHLPMAYFEKRHMGDLVSRFNSLQPIKRLLTDGIINVFVDGLMAITTLIMMLIYSPLLCLVSISAWTCYFAFRIMLFNKLRSTEEVAILESSKENSLFMESLRGLTTLKLFGGEDDRHRLWQNTHAGVVNSGANVAKLKGLFTASTIAFNGLELILIIFIAAQMVMAGEFTIGMIFAYQAYRASFSSKASSLVEQAIEFRMLSLHLERLSDIVVTESEKNTDEASDEELIKGNIQLKNIFYSYSKESSPVLYGINLDIRSGENVAIVGPTGCGKSTLFKVLTSLIEPTFGEIFIDGKKLNKNSYHNYRKKIGVVMQDDALLSGTIAENISFFDADINEEKYLHAAELACIKDEITQFPMQFESMIGDMGSALSGGQRQRLSIARALYRNPKILFMDEGTSHLDVLTEEKVNDAINSLGITCVIIAHRPETILAADRIFSMHMGRIEEITHSDYRKLFLTKNAEEEGCFPSSSGVALSNGQY